MGIIDKIGGILLPFYRLLDELTTSDEERMKLRNGLREIEERLSGLIIESKKEVMLAELKQEDRYTKRARPTLIYGGLLILFLNYVLLPWLFYISKGGINLPKIELPGAFWYAWGGACGVYSFGRSKEKIARMQR